jgi:hypothetical protein
LVYFSVVAVVCWFSAVDKPTEKTLTSARICAAALLRSLTPYKVAVPTEPGALSKAGEDDSMTRSYPDPILVPEYFPDGIT